MASIKFSICIPTRERAATIGPCIETCLAQCYDDMEILISDNASLDKTAEVVKSFNSPKIKYFRQAKRISMRQNFEFLANKATGDYVIFIGDDDGLMPLGLKTLANFLAKQPVDVINWTGVVYYWPDRLKPGVGLINFKYQKLFGGLSFPDPKKRLAALSSGRTESYIYGSNLYHGCVSKRVIDEVRHVTGRVFSDHMPDVYACVAFLFSARSMAYFDHPISICGVSLASNGFSFFADRQSGEREMTPTERFADEANADPDIKRPYNPHLRASQYHTASALLIANDYFGRPSDIDLDAWARIIIREAAQYCDLLSIADTLDLSFDLDRKIADTIKLPAGKIRAVRPAPEPASKAREKFNRMWVRAQYNDRDDVMGAFQTIERLLPRREIGNSNILVRFLKWLRLHHRRRQFDHERGFF
jgi:glycosyltransferase involved in cell wall biosynthesis